MSAIIEARGLSKAFKGFQAVKDLSFTIQHGEVYGFLGQNGAGKSTTMRMLLGLIFADSGSIYINGEEFNNNRRYLLKNIGAIIERPDLYGYLSGWENLKMFAALSDKRINENRLHEVLEIVGLRGRERDKVKAYSQGMKQRLGIAIAMVHNPDLLILDEPTNGLDPQGIAEIRMLINTLSKEHGTTILVSSHLLHEIEQVATNMLIIHKGRKVNDGPVSTLLDPDKTLIEVGIIPNDMLAKHLADSRWATQLAGITEGMLTFKMNPALVPELNNWLVNAGGLVTGINSKHSLEAYFLSITDDTATQH